jgi:hypothetical protein
MPKVLPKRMRWNCCGPQLRSTDSGEVGGREGAVLVLVLVPL